MVDRMVDDGLTITGFGSTCLSSIDGCNFSCHPSFSCPGFRAWGSRFKGSASQGLGSLVFWPESRPDEGFVEYGF